MKTLFVIILTLCSYVGFSQYKVDTNLYWKNDGDTVLREYRIISNEYDADGTLTTTIEYTKRVRRCEVIDDKQKIDTIP